MAQLLGLSPNTVSAIENGDAREIKLGVVHDYARITNSPEAFLIFGDDYLKMTLYRLEEAKEVITRTLETTTEMIKQDRSNFLPKKK